MFFASFTLVAMSLFWSVEEISYTECLKTDACTVTSQAKKNCFFLKVSSSRKARAGKAIYFGVCPILKCLSCKSLLRKRMKTKTLSLSIGT